MQSSDPYHDLVPVPRVAITLPLALPVPAGFDPERLETWPDVDGELEYVGGRLYYMPPSADLQQDTVADVVGVLKIWQRQHRDFVVATNEAGIVLGGETRGSDAAVWQKADVESYRGELRRTPPMLAVEVAGSYDTEERLRDKAAWYIDHGVQVVWLLFPSTKLVVVIETGGDRSFGPGAALPANPSLPDLAPLVDELFEQVSGA